MISENKLHHIIGVARQCESIAKDMGLSQEMQDACFVMGLLHDIGYERTEPDYIYDHPQKGFNMLCHALEYKENIARAILEHGTKYEDLDVFDEILNMADLTINFYGKEVTLEKRLDDIKLRHGETSEHYQNALHQYEAVCKAFGKHEV